MAIFLSAPEKMEYDKDSGRYGQKGPPDVRLSLFPTAINGIHRDRSIRFPIPSLKNMKKKKKKKKEKVYIFLIS